MEYDHRTVGAALAGAGVIAMLTLRFWASPLTSAVLGRDQVGLVPFLGIPLLLLLVGAGIAIAVWGDELGLS